ncbi:MAG: ATP-binding protein [Oscillospiraceae bacterium]|jgi:hypothetical protein|nr:ATP-binding protein [Oscillospiraceae bacterium]
MRYFNIARPCNKAEHYMIEAASRLSGVERLIDRTQYFVIHAARQSGKTTYLRDLTRRLNASCGYYALYCSLEIAQGIIDPKDSIPSIVKKIKYAVDMSDIPSKGGFAADADYADYTNVLNKELSLFGRQLDRPLVVLFDEADCLSEGTLITFLRQLRDERTRALGIEQTLRYMDVYGAAEGWLAIFDRSGSASWDEKIYIEKEAAGDKTVTVVGL